jgi:hypothetical protein
MKTLTYSFKLALLVLICINTTYAQKTPKIQEVSVRAPEKLKIDGKLDEWGPFKASNPIVRLDYTLSNDDKNLYLVASTKGTFGNDKVLNGGIMLVVSHSLEKRKREKDINNVSVTFPIVDKEKNKYLSASSDKYFINWSGARRAGHQKEIDSVYTVINKQAGESFKEIKVKGIKDVDSLISIYNTEGIKAMARYDSTMLYTCEMVIPLKLLGLDANNATTFSYGIVLAGTPRATIVIEPDKIRSVPIPVDRIVPMSSIGMPMPPPNPNTAYIWDPQNFWAEYTLAKKMKD